MNRTLLLVATVALLGGCTVSDQQAVRAAEAVGLRDVKLGGPSLFGCSDKDNFTRTFEAKSPTGQPVRGAVCKGLMKGATVRTF